MAEVSRESQVPPCPFCNSPGQTVTEGGFRTYTWECGAWARAGHFDRDGAQAVVDYDSTCDLRIQITEESLYRGIMYDALKKVRNDRRFDKMDFSVQVAVESSIRIHENYEGR